MPKRLGPLLAVVFARRARFVKAWCARYPLPQLLSRLKVSQDSEIFVWWARITWATVFAVHAIHPQQFCTALIAGRDIQNIWLLCTHF